MVVGAVEEPDADAGGEGEVGLFPGSPHGFESDDGFGGFPPAGRPAVFGSSGFADIEAPSRVIRERRRCSIGGEIRMVRSPGWCGPSCAHADAQQCPS